MTRFATSIHDLAGRNALITGAASGIGAALARALAAVGVRVVLADVDREAVEKLAAEISASRGQAAAIAFDVRDADGWCNAVSFAEETFGRIDVLCNNAGVGTSRRRVHELSAQEFEFTFGVNVGGVLNGIRAVVPGMLADGQPGVVMNTASILSHFPLAGAADYVASKYAVMGISETLRAELLDSDIAVVVLCPGLVDTGIHANSRALRENHGVPPHAAHPGATSVQPAPGLDPRLVADAAVEAIVDGRFHVFTHPEYAETIAVRSREIAAAIESSRPLGDPEPVGFLGRSVFASGQ